MRFNSSYGLIALALVMSGTALAAEAPNQVSTEISNRMSRRLGFYLGVNEPAPVLVGMNAAYHLTDFLRASAGFGKVTTTTGITLDQNGLSTTEASETTMGVAVRGYMPGWNLTPSVGLGFANVSYAGILSDVAQGGSHLYASVGADYQARSGFNAAAGIQQSFKSSFGTNVYVTAGWFVDWL
ncbi:MAG TPA: hypothetical protein VM598_05580 [Bdellovibrionota bacterium]|nr:hypothetical protein [Bdellovibrionota bacterium]